MTEIAKIAKDSKEFAKNLRNQKGWAQLRPACLKARWRIYIYIYIYIYIHTSVGPTMYIIGEK